ncbi:GNAT family N-acetyltransferase [Kiloniella sp. EL199]|uniref:GNAT family N-acetyltransferase n=1 Tax=Kiloniella sp. EL199 TaxID=2107581 RepID=UPI000EA2DBC9|nr:GNAT family protein [Kiloniella sp. EL199]
MIAPEIKIPNKPTYLMPFLPLDITPIYLAWLNDKEITQFTEIAKTKQSAEDCRDYVTKSNSSSDEFLWRIVTETHGHVGNIRLSGLSSPHQRGELALIIGNTNLHGKGIGTQAIKLATMYAFNELKLHKITAGMYMPNEGSYKAFLNAGYHLEATLKDHVLFNGHFTDVYKVACFNQYEQNL